MNSDFHLENVSITRKTKIVKTRIFERHIRVSSILQDRDHWVLDIYSLTLKKHEKVQTLTEERTCSFLSKFFGLLCEGYSSSAGKDSTDVVRTCINFCL